jgi:hypothetical protein
MGMIFEINGLWCECLAAFEVLSAARNPSTAYGEVN